LEEVRHRPLHRQEISQLVTRQLGHVTRAQLLALELSAAWVDHRVAVGELIPVHAGVYAVGHVPRHAHARAMAAVLACGPGAALSHAAAAALWGVADWPRTLEVSAPGDRRRPGLITHRSRTLGPRDLRTHHGVRTTSPARTVLDLQRRLTDARLARTVNDLRVAGHLGETAFAELRRTSARVEELLGDGRPTRSWLEDLFRRFVTRHRLPMPEVNAVLPESGREVDALYREARLIVELDSWKYHGDRAAFERDRAKDARALADGYRTLRATRRRLTRGGAEEAAMIRRILDRT
jgi:very-short-patch-repair endonuclease